MGGIEIFSKYYIPFIVFILIGIVFTTTISSAGSKPNLDDWTQIGTNVYWEDWAIIYDDCPMNGNHMQRYTYEEAVMEFKLQFNAKIELKANHDMVKTVFTVAEDYSTTSGAYPEINYDGVSFIMGRISGISVMGFELVDSGPYGIDRNVLLSDYVYVSDESTYGIEMDMWRMDSGTYRVDLSISGIGVSYDSYYEYDDPWYQPPNWGYVYAKNINLGFSEFYMSSSLLDIYDRRQPSWNEVQEFDSAVFDVQDGWNGTQLFGGEVKYATYEWNEVQLFIDGIKVIVSEEALSLYFLIWLIVLFFPALIFGFFIPKIGFILGLSMMNIVLYLSGEIPFWLTFVLFLGVGILIYRRD